MNHSYLQLQIITLMPDHFELLSNIIKDFKILYEDETLETTIRNLS